MNLLLLFPTVWSWLITVRAWNRKRIKCVLIEPDHSTFSCQGDCKYDVVGGKVGGRTLHIISTACKLNGSLETAHSVYIVKSIIWQRPVTGGHIHNPVSYDIADIHSVLLSVFSVLYHDVGPRKTHLNMKYTARTDRCFRVTDVIYIHKRPLIPPSCCLKLTTAFFIGCGCTCM